MTKKIVDIKSENVFLEYLYARLDKGITEGITEEDYSNFLNTIVNNINSDESDYSIRTIMPSDSFLNIAEKAMEKTVLPYNKKLTGLDLKNGILYPTYNLRKLEWNDYKLFRGFGRGQDLVNKTLEQHIKVPNLSEYPLNESNNDNFETSKKVAAYFVNDIIERYLKDRVEKGCWPKQCKDSDEFIFKRNIGKLIDEKGTKENFKIAYYQAIRVITELLENKESLSDNLIVSNNDKFCLAYANYLKIITPEALSFLLPYRYNEYQLRNARIDVSIINNQTQFKTSECIYSDPYGDWSDDYSRKEGIINDVPVLVMEKRIGKILKK
ncbi:MAG: hypothetical protein PHX03_04650 [Bacilli bacterium]|nr:hypothetical protein [Bacilli bacterium]